MSKDCVKLLRLARATVIEKMFFDALVRPQLVETTRTEEINDTVGKMDKASLSITDISPALWAHCQRVVGGENLS